MLKEIYNSIMDKLILSKRTRLYKTLAIILILGIGYADFITGYEICFSLFYIIPIALATLGGSYIWGFVFSTISTIFWLTADIKSGMTFSHISIIYWNGLMRFGFYSIISLFIHTGRNFLKKETTISKFKTDMLSSISHEFNNLLSGMNLTSTLLEEGEEKNISEERLNLYKIHRHSYSVMKRQIKVFLNNSRLESGAIKPDIKKTEMRAVINNATNYLLPIAYEKNIAIEKHFPKEPIPVSCDIDLMNLAISNLIANAIKYSPKDKNIHVSITQINENTMEIAVKDNGIGIKREDFDKILTGYYRTEESKNHASGFGIGLKLTKDIIELHNSKLMLESEKGQGSRFHFTLPIFR
jgi:signal transduction histidine kinase